MALVPAGPGSGWYLSVSLTDNDGSVSTLEYELRAIDITEAQAAVVIILTALAGVSGSVISAYNLSLRYWEDAFAYPGSGIRNEVKARVVGQLTGSTKKATFDIPAPVDGIFNGTSGEAANIVNVSAPALVSYAAIFKTATNVAFISDGEDLDFTIRGRRVSVKRGLRA